MKRRLLDADRAAERRMFASVDLSSTGLTSKKDAFASQLEATLTRGTEQMLDGRDEQAATHGTPHTMPRTARHTPCHAHGTPDTMPRARHAHGVRATCAVLARHARAWCTWLQALKTLSPLLDGRLDEDKHRAPLVTASYGCGVACYHLGDLDATVEHLQASSIGQLHRPSPEPSPGLSIAPPWPPPWALHRPSLGPPWPLPPGSR